MTLKNTAKWQLSSSLLQGFISGIRNAISFTKELDKSLNDIRIVTGYSAERMADFAVQANKAAKELSTTTKNYTDASLIFFQQGLSDEEVKARTDVTIKMARVTGEAASDVSSYMTAIWNNFDDGSHSLEHYADVITALGAATASSSEEIAGGLEKFAAIADTVGLSYEYATSALATVVAETRQSEETVGTSFKTIFGRLQSLNLGENLDDGTSLTKYSQALDVVGISIKEQDGALKSMNDILDELGSKWAGLSQETKVALANTVAGTRQYTNFIALMDSYDTFKINLDIAENAEGTMDEQFKIYEDSWEGAQMRMKASAESLYSSLVPKEFLVDAVDGLGKFLDGLTEIVESFGGLKGILLTISTILLNKF
jgi:TP901 family phage tail tape measure protein